MDNPFRYAELARILEKALELLPSERRDFLASATDDPELAREAEKLLREDEEAERRPKPAQAKLNLIETRTWTDLAIGGGLEPGERVGPFTLVEELGRGGMGTVYLAEQDEPVHRRVALKVIDRSVDSQANLRFEAEREALARLHHVNIAALYEAGTAENGTPFFAMELVEGEPILDYCDSRRLDVHGRLSLFRKVCRGVAHAHEKGILHRDINPSNVLVTESEGRAEPKIIDFGIAKGLEASLIDKTLETGSNVLGTPAFMSPESLGLTDWVDARSDVYALGVLLYELVADVRPVGQPDDTSVRLMRRIVNDDSRTLIECWEDMSSKEQRAVAARRNGSPKRLRRLFEGDLGSMALRAVARRPEERYESARELLTELERYLGDQPMVAGSPSTPDLLRQVVGRHRGLTTAVGFSLCALVLLSIGAAVGFLNARQAEHRALAQAHAAVEALHEAQEINDFLVGIFQASGVDPQNARPLSEITARELLELGSKRIETDYRDQPVLVARLRQTLGQIYREFELHEETIEIEGRSPADEQPD